MEKSEDISLGLDISTSIIGICLFRKKDFLKFYHLDLTKTKCVFEKSKKFESLILEIYEK